jgi:hypothetical protein
MNTSCLFRDMLWIGKISKAWNRLVSDGVAFVLMCYGLNKFWDLLP